MMLELMRRAMMIVVLSVSPILTVSSCTPNKPNELDKLGTIRMSIKGVPFELWIADDSAEQQRGLMFVTSEQMAPLPDGTRRGMIFVFDHERELNFWMKNTIIPLDIAYVRTDGTVVSTYTMAALDASSGKYPSRSSARIAIEVNADTYKELGLRPGDVIDIPPTLLTPTP